MYCLVLHCTELYCSDRVSALIIVSSSAGDLGQVCCGGLAEAAEAGGWWQPQMWARMSCCTLRCPEHTLTPSGEADSEGGTVTGHINTNTDSTD